MHVFDRTVQFQDVDAAGIVFFARFFVYAHDAMVSLFDTLPGGYASFINVRKIGFPAVHVEADFESPLRFGDVARIHVEATRIGQKSVTLRFTFHKDGRICAIVTNTVVLSDLVAMKGVDIPEDVRAFLQRHVTP